jgi:hypothetical protein
VKDSDQQQQACAKRQGGGAGAVYGLGLIGAVVWFWKQATTPEEQAIAVLKALVWPAFLVYRAFKALSD